MFRIMTWNTALTEESDSQSVIQYIKNFVDENNSLAVLQQIPYKDANNNFVLHQVYSDFMKTFPDSEYKVFQNNTYNKGRIVMMTVIVTKMRNVIISSMHSTQITNRESAVTINLEKNNHIDVYGIHARNGKDNMPYLKSLNNAVDADIILGDFNAGDYDDCQNRSTFCSILKDYVCICNMPTKEIRKEFIEVGEKKYKIIRKTCIDYIFVRRNLVTKCSNLIVHENTRLSDHYPITVDIDL